jgi:hypothetical protein
MATNFGPHVRQAAFNFHTFLIIFILTICPNGRLPLTHFLPSKLPTTYSFAQVKFEKNEWCQKKS